MRRIAEKVIGGWQVNSIITMLSGFPFTPLVGSNRSGDGDTRNPDRPILESGIFRSRRDSARPNQWFNPNAFRSARALAHGAIWVEAFIQDPGLAAADISLFKNMAFTERTHLQFRAEAFNALNHANFGTPNATVFSGAAFSPTAGLITTTATTSRQIQFGMKLISHDALESSSVVRRQLPRSI